MYSKPYGTCRYSDLGMVPGLSYWVRNKLYIALTNECVSLSPIALRGPSFIMPKDSLFQPLSWEPVPSEIMLEIDNAFNSNKISITSMGSDEITFAGLGEPLLRIQTLIDSAFLIKQKRHGVPLRLKTSGLVHSRDCERVQEYPIQNFDFKFYSQFARSLKDADIDKISISLLADNPKDYESIMQPHNGANFSDVCTFIISCVEKGNETSFLIVHNYCN